MWLMYREDSETVANTNQCAMHKEKEISIY